MRWLSDGERLIWVADRRSPLNFVLAAHLVTELPAEALRAGILCAVARWPVLGMSVGVVKKRPAFVPGALSVVLQTVENRVWVELAEEQLNRSFDLPSEPLMRLIRVRCQGEHLLLVLHHSLGDGLSGLLLLREILSGAAAWLRGEKRAPEPLPLSVPLEARRLLGTLQPSAPPSEGLRLLDEEVDPAKRETVIIPQLLGQEETRALVARTRERKVSVHGLLAACQLQAIAAEHGGVARLSLSSPYNLRTRLEPLVGEELGLFIGDARASYKVDEALTPWKLASAVSADVGQAARSGANMGAGGGQQVDLGRIYAHRVSTAMSNLGVFRLADTLHPVEVLSIHFAVACSVLGDQIGAVVTANGRLAHTFCAMSPTLSPARIRRIAEGTMGRLREVL